MRSPAYVGLRIFCSPQRNAQGNTMSRTLFSFCILFALSMTTATASDTPVAAQPSPETVLVIGHRGASALVPEHTLASYLKAIEDGADWIEPDLVSTRDGVLVARHENEIGSTTNVALHAEFADRRRNKVIDGQPVEGWFTEDFSLAELRTLRVRERLPQLRSQALDGQFSIPTLEEIIQLVTEEAKARGRVIGLIPELKHPTHFRSIDLPMEDRLLDVLHSHAYTRTAPVVIQSFEITNLKYLGERIRASGSHIQLLQLLGDPAQQPADVLATGQGPSYAQMMTLEGLQDIAGYASHVGPHTRMIIPLDDTGALGTPTSLVNDAHAAGLRVIAYTFRPENYFLPRTLWSGEDPRTRNEAGSVAEIRVYLQTGIDGFFTDDPAIGRRAVDGD